MVDIIGYIKNFFSYVDNRKRKLPSDLPYSPSNAKMRKIQSSPIQSSSQGDEWYSPNTIRRRSALSTSFIRNKPISSKENVTLVIDDEEDDILEISKLKHSNKFSSTPNGSVSRSANVQQNGDDDVVFLKSSKSIEEKKLKAKKLGFDYLKPYSYLSDNQNKSRNTINTKHEMNSPILSSMIDTKNQLKMNRPQIGSSVSNQSFRLGEKMKYKQLLSEVAAHNSSFTNSFSNYSTPQGKIFIDNSTTRGAKLVDMALKKGTKMTTFVDLTINGTTDVPRKQMSTVDTIRKVLGESSSEPIAIKDTDSDIEILPNPPSPKPDIKVDRVNSLKKIVDASEETHTDWLKRMIEKHKKDVEKFESDIRNQTAQRKKLGQVTSEIQAQRLQDQMVKCLKIKDIVFPVRLEEVAFPELSEDDEYRIDRALKGKRSSTSEVLAQKFNLNITRADIQTLDGLNWLNDEVINFYMNLLIERGKDSKWPRAYAMNTFFYPKLLKDGPSSLRRWTRKVDIFSYDIIAVPIHLGMHWCMSIIDFKNCTIKYYDSMGRSNNCCLEALLNYLKAEHLDKKQKEYNVSKWTLENVQDIPQQMNGSDCGVFACTYAEFLTRDADLSFDQENMPYLRRKMVLEILNGELLIK
ncbi:hypothetical protein FQR65_LT10909 [Abscondita terminalis]|nr:hypothetical protein FQR65_LT10909 [Abscondita terminalis]